MKTPRPILRRITQTLSLVGSIVAALGASLAPCCLPLLGFFPALAGWGGWAAGSPWITQGSAAIALVGFWLGRHRFGGIVSLLFGLTGAGLILIAYHVRFDVLLVYAGLAFLFAAAIGPWTYRFLRRLLRLPILRSVLTCPACRFRQTEITPTNACLYFWNCPKCGARVRPLSGACCVFCSYGSVPCPSIQLGGCPC